MGRGWRRHEWSQPVDMKRQTNTTQRSPKLTAEIGDVANRVVGRRIPSNSLKGAVAVHRTTGNWRSPRFQPVLKLWRKS